MNKFVLVILLLSSMVPQSVFAIPFSESFSHRLPSGPNPEFETQSNPSTIQDDVRALLRASQSHLQGATLIFSLFERFQVEDFKTLPISKRQVERLIEHHG